jgi:succinate dehydrogenase hydrophobic anchor subunit
MRNKQPKLKTQRSWVVYLATGLLIISLAFVAVTFLLLTRNAQHEQEWMSLARQHPGTWMHSWNWVIHVERSLQP